MLLGSWPRKHQRFISVIMEWKGLKNDLKPGHLVGKRSLLTTGITLLNQQNKAEAYDIRYGWFGCSSRTMKNLLRKAKVIVVGVLD